MLLSKLFFTIILSLLTLTVSAQTEIAVKSPDFTKNDSISALTKFRLMTNDGFTEERIANLQETFPERMQYLNYYYSKSFTIKAGQNYTDEQYFLIDMARLNLQRDLNTSKEIFDPMSKLTLILDSETSVLNTRDTIMYPNGKPMNTSKFTTH